MKTQSQYEADVYALWGDKYRVIGKYTGNKNKIKMYHSKCNCEFEVVPINFLLKHSTCPVCCNRLIIKGVNDINTTNPEIAKYTLNPEDKYHYSERSNVKIDWKCPNCGSIIKNKSFDSVKSRGLACSFCSDGISYPNKFFRELFTQLNRESKIKNYIAEYSPSWIAPKRYDNYFEIDNEKYIIEVDGGLGHGKYVIDKARHSIEDTKEQDRLKNNFAFEHNIKLIRINADESNLRYLKKQIYESELINILDLSVLDWDLCNLRALSSKKIKAIELYNSGLKNTNDIAKLLNLNINTIATYLKDGTKNNMCDYDPKETKYRHYNTEGLEKRLSV